MRLLFFISLVNAICLSSMASMAAEPLAIELVAERYHAANGNVETSAFEIAQDVPLGERVYFTLLVRNTSVNPLQSPIIDYAIPRNTRYIDGSAMGPGAQVSVSVDGGVSFDELRRLQVPVTVGVMRAAVGGDCTHLRWKLRHALLPGSVAKLRFRAEFR